MASCVELEYARKSREGVSRPDGEKNRLDAVNRCTDVYLKLAKRWENQTALLGHSLIENYCEGRLAFVCDLDISVPQASVIGCPIIGDHPVGNLNLLVSLVYKANTIDYSDLHMRNDELMLIGNVETVQSPEGSPIPSSVRLYRIHDVVDDWARGLRFESAIDGAEKLIPSFADEETGFVVPSASVSKLNIADSEIESRSEIMKCVSKDQREIIRNRLTRFDVNNITSALRIVLDQETVRIVRSEVPHLSFKIVDVLFGSSEL